MVGYIPIHLVIKTSKNCFPRYPKKYYPMIFPHITWLIQPLPQWDDQDLLGFLSLSWAISLARPVPILANNRPLGIAGPVRAGDWTGSEAGNISTFGT
jgi:hypothetical protein